MQFREADISFTRAEGDAAATVEIAFSSEAPVERYDWWEGERYLEVLDHSPSAVDLSYARDGMPLLVTHDDGEQVGIIEGVRVDADRKLRGTVRWSKAPRAQEIRQDVLDGIRKKVSIGYRLDLKNMEVTKEKDGLATRRYKRWLPMEGSIVAIPADYSVGVGRSANAPADIPTKPAPPEEHFMSEKDTRDPGAAPQVKVQVTKDECAERAELIRSIAKLAGAEDKAAEWILSGKSAAEVQTEAYRLVLEKGANTRTVGSPTPFTLDLPKSETREFSVARAIRATYDNSVDDGFEREVSQELSRITGRKPTGVGFLMPTMSTRVPHNVGTAGQGGNAVATELLGLIELLRNRSVVLQLGASLYPGLVGNVAFPRQVTSGTASWQSENPGSDVAESITSLDQVTLSPKTLMSTQAYSRQLLAQSSFDIDAYVRNDLASIMALEIDRAALHGSGASGQPLGLFGTSGIGSVAFGGSITFAKCVDMESQVFIGNADVAGMAYCASPETRGKGKTTLIASAAGSAMVWTGGREGEVNGYKAVASNQVAKNLGAGTNEHAIFFGNWPELLIGEWGAMEIIVDPYSRARQGLVNITSIAFVDVDVRHGASFCKGTGLIP